eukprot:jgi/Antlo1/1488/1368
MLLVTADFDSTLDGLHNAGLVRTSSRSASIEVFDGLVKLKGSTCHYFAEDKHMHLSTDFLDRGDPKKTFALKISRYECGETRATVFQGEHEGATKFVVVDGLDGEEAGCGEVRLVRLLVEKGIL